MYMNEITKLFEKHDSEHSTVRRDVQAFMLLDKLFPNHEELIIGSNERIIWFGVENEEMEKVLNEVLIIELLRHGIFLNTNNYKLAMFI